MDQAERRRVRAKLSASGPTRWLASGELPTEQRERGARRLGILGLMTAFSYTFLGFIYSGGQMPSGSLAVVPMAASVVGVSFSITIFALSRRKATDPGWLLNLGIAYQIVMGLAIGASRHFLPWPPHAFERGWSGVAAWVVVFAIAVPSNPARTFWVSLVVALSDPLVLLATVVAGNPMPTSETIPTLFGPSVIAVATAVVASVINFRMGRRIEDAQELGSYKLVAPLGKGGMGEVWRAEHKLLARPAAIKLIRADTLDATSAEDRLRRFEREAQATALLQSEHTIALYDFGVATDGAFYYVMELLDGLDLEAAVRGHGPMPAERAVHLLLQVCDSLAEAHARGLTHRDIKPANIYLCRRALAHDRIKVLDFGLVKPRAGLAGDGNLTADGAIRGTPAYMAPELVEGRAAIDGRADLYAVGCVGYWLLTGKLVFEAETPMQMVLAHARSAPPPPSTRGELAIPPALEALILRCLEKDPARRPQSAEELAGSLARIELAAPWTEARAREWWERCAGRTAGCADPLETTAPLA